MPALEEYAEETVVPRIAIAFPLALPLPDGFDPGRLETWPRVEGRLEYVDGRLEYLPRCGGDEGATVADCVADVHAWVRERREFVA